MRTATPYGEHEPGVFQRPCQACDGFAPVDDLGLYEQCSAKLDRDMIRQRAWDYSATAFAVPPERYDELRSATIAKYGAAMELVAAEPEPKPAAGRRSGRWRR